MGPKQQSLRGLFGSCGLPAAPLARSAVELEPQCEVVYDPPSSPELLGSEGEDTGNERMSPPAPRTATARDNTAREEVKNKSRAVVRLASQSQSQLEYETEEEDEEEDCQRSQLLHSLFIGHSNHNSSS
jgi:hypothetical protein